jgi:transmembrane sensor
MIDDAVRAMAEREAAWDPLRERRVLARVEAELDRRGAQRGARRWLPAAMVAVAAILVAVLAWPRSEVASGQAILGGLASAIEPLPTIEAGSLPAIPTMPAGAIALGDGSIATLHDGARIGLRVQTTEEIRIEQSLGRVHYEVRPGLPRTFVVEADDVRVVVVGTAFWVTREPDSVRVTVEHGRVRVQRDGDETDVVIAELGAGDELRVGTAPAPTPAVRPARPVAKLRAKPVVEGPSVDELLAQADAARARSELAAAATALREVVEHHGDDPRAYGSAFQLGKVERSRGRHAAAARAFAGAAKRSPAGALTEDARAESAISWFDAGLYTEARDAGEDYLARHPDGTHAARVQRMLQRLP